MKAAIAVEAAAALIPDGATLLRRVGAGSPWPRPPAALFRPRPRATSILIIRVKIRAQYFDISRLFGQSTRLGRDNWFRKIEACATMPIAMNARRIQDTRYLRLKGAEMEKAFFDPRGQRNPLKSLIPDKEIQEKQSFFPWNNLAVAWPGLGWL